MFYLPFIIFIIFATKLSIIDYRTFRLPNKLVAAGYLGTFSVVLLNMNLDRIVKSFAMSCIYLICFIGLQQISRNSIGYGDVKYSALCGLQIGFYSSTDWLTWTWLIGIWLMFLSAALQAIFQILLSRKSFKERLAFGPHMSLATIVLCLNSLSAQ
jgi:Flp pilus assembly protein protease CpaA